MGSSVAIEPSGIGLPSRARIEDPKLFWADPSCRASVSELKHHRIPRSLHAQVWQRYHLII
jgi:hypothetical protein